MVHGFVNLEKVCIHRKGIYFRHKIIDSIFSRKKKCILQQLWWSSSLTSIHVQINKARPRRQDMSPQSLWLLNHVNMNITSGKRCPYFWKIASCLKHHVDGSEIPSAIHWMLFYFLTQKNNLFYLCTER